MRQILKTGFGITVVGFILFFGSPKITVANNDIIISGATTQSEFQDLTEQLGLTISYMPLAPAEPLGFLGFDAGIEITAVNIDQSKSVWSNVISDGSVPDYVFLPKLHVQIGLPLNLDVGAVYSKVPDSNVSMIGGELKWAFIEGGAAMPAVALRGSYTKLLGVSDLDLNTYGLDLSISKGVLFFTPYAGVGMVWMTGREHSSTVSLDSEQVNRVKGFLGLRASFLHFISLVAEANFSAIQAYSLRLNLSF